MPNWFWPLAGLCSIAVAILTKVVPALRAKRRAADLDRAKRDFHRQRERLEAKFVRLAAGSGKPRGLRWTNCDFDDDVAYARDRRTGQLTALVALAISFDAVEGGGMEEVEAVGNLRAATAVFHEERGRWSTEGRAIFNLNPHEAIAHFGRTLESAGDDSVLGRV